MHAKGSYCACESFFPQNSEQTRAEERDRATALSELVLNVKCREPHALTIAQLAFSTKHIEPCGTTFCYACSPTSAGVVAGSIAFRLTSDSTIRAAAAANVCGLRIDNRKWLVPAEAWLNTVGTI